MAAPNDRLDMLPHVGIVIDDEDRLVVFNDSFSLTTARTVSSSGSSDSASSIYSVSV